MADAAERKHQYTYGANSNLVIQRDRTGPRETGPSGEVSSISAVNANKLQSQFGSLVARGTRGAGSEFDERLKKVNKARKRKQAKEAYDDRSASKRQKKRIDGHDILDDEVNLSSYRPRTGATRIAYSVFLDLIKPVCPGEGTDMVRDFAEMVLTILKNESLTAPQKRAEVEAVFGKKLDPPEVFDKLSNASRSITDFSASAADGDNDDDGDNEGADGAPKEYDPLDDNVPVVFDTDDERDSDIGSINSEEADSDDDMDGSDADGVNMMEDDGDGTRTVYIDRDGRKSVMNGGETPMNGVDTPHPTTKREVERAQRERERMMRANAVLKTDSEFQNASHVDMDDPRTKFDVRNVKAYWLQHELAEIEATIAKEEKDTTPPDPVETQKKADEIFAILSDEKQRKRQLENEFMTLLRPKAGGSIQKQLLTFMKLLINHRWEIVYAIKLDRANPKERKEIEKYMRTNAEYRAILEEFNKTESTVQDRTKLIQRNIRAQAQSLRSGDEKHDDGGGHSALANGAAGKGGGEAAGKTFDPTKEGGAPEAGGQDEYFQKKLLIDLDGLAFKQGGHLMSNKQYSVTDKTTRTRHKGYVEIYVPYTEAPPLKPGDELPIAKLPKWTHPSFQSYGENKHTQVSKLNRVQSKVFPCAFESPENMLLCAPTGAGKTVCAQLCMLREIGLHRQEDGSIDLSAFKIVYIAPMKSLVREMVNNFSNRFKCFDINVRELSGDRQLSQQQIQDTQIIVTTPEKWDIITRKSGDRTYTQLVKLVILDEVHLLHDSRGPVLESVIARTIRQVETSQEVIRMVGLSATVPNPTDVALFLRVNVSKDNNNLFVFESKYRPCPLTQAYVGVTVNRPFKQYQLMNQICYDKVMAQRKSKNQVLVFVHSRKETSNTARYLMEQAQEKDELSTLLNEEGAKQALLEEVDAIKDLNLKDLLPYGIGIHHAGMRRTDRATVEDMFREGYIQVLVSTATLAWGVNLPAHCVIIKGTQVYSPERSRWVELSMLDVLQMTGRAGRPGLDTYGEAFILTTQKELKFYMSLLQEQLPIESQLISKLADNLNAEIVLGTVRNVREAVQWLHYTYLYVRMLKSPELYGCPAGDLAHDEQLIQRRVDLIHSAATILDKARLVKYDRKGAAFQVTDLGRVSSHFYLTHETMSTFAEYMKPTMSDIEILRVFSLAQEFAGITVREEEKLELMKLLDKVPIPVKETIEEPSAKVNVLLQAYISRLKLDGFALLADMQYVTQSAGRLMRALFTIALKQGWASVSMKCLALAKMIDKRMWGIESPLRQFPKVLPAEVIRRIERKEFTWERFFDLKANEIGELIHFPQLGRKVHKHVHIIPKVELQGHVQPITRNLLLVELTVESDFQFDADHHYVSEPFWIIVEDVDGETILHHEEFLLRHDLKQQTVRFSIPILEPLPPQYFCRVISDRWIGSETVMPISFTSLILPEKYPPPTELLDLQPQPVNCFDNPNFSKLYKFKYFNPIQTQTFHTLFKTDSSVLVCAPTGSGKTICAEFAVLRMIENFPNGKCIYIAPSDALVDERYHDWSSAAKFGGKLSSEEGVKVVRLSGDTTTDLKMLAHGTIVITSAVNWDIMSRRWKTRKNVQNVSLVIADELHLIGGEHGPTFEMVISRMRYISQQTDNPIRIVGLSSSIANADNLGEWLGASPSHQFNFPPTVRPVRLDTSIQGVDINHYQSRQLAMVKPAYMALTYRSPKKPVIVFVPSRQIARRVAKDFMKMAAAEKRPDRFVHVNEDVIAPLIKDIHTKFLKTLLLAGIAFYHSRLTEKEKKVIKMLFDAGAIQLLVAEASTCWGMSMKAHMVVVMGTQRYDGQKQRYADYPITDILQMMGLASRPLTDATAKCAVFCHAPRKDYYKKFLYEPLPIESHLDHYLADHMNAEIVTKTVENVQEAVDYLTWTFFYRRLHLNPNYYNLKGTGHRHISDHLSGIVEETLGSLETARCISLTERENGIDATSALNCGMIAAYYYIQYGTIEVFSSMLQKKMVLKKILETLVNAEEFQDRIPIRPSETAKLADLSKHLPLHLPNGKFSEPRTKVHLLLQTHFGRLPLASEIGADRTEAVKISPRLLLAMVDVISSNGWLTPCLATMELCQMITQGMWDNHPPVRQLPYMDDYLPGSNEVQRWQKCKELGIDSVTEFEEAEAADMVKALKVTPTQYQKMMSICNDYPDTIDVNWEIADSDDIRTGRPVVVKAEIVREDEDDEEEDQQPYVVPMVWCPRYDPDRRKSESWWLVIGNQQDNKLLAIKRIPMRRRVHSVQLQFDAPRDPGTYKYTLYLMSDSYLGLDQEFELKFEVNEAGDSSDEEESDGSDMSDE